MQTSRIALGALAISASAACQPPEADTTSATTDDAPVVGRLITRERVIDLTVHAFADSQGPVPTGSYARLMADVAEGSVQDARTSAPVRPGARDAREERERDDASFLRRAF